MGNNFSEKIRSIQSGDDRRQIASLARAASRIAEIPYTILVAARNRLYDRGIFASHRLARPVISVGNITTGGTGKTPVVRWLAESLRDTHPAILLRGYKSADDRSDEQLLLQQYLQDIPVIARPDRRRGAAVTLAQQSTTGLFILDDGMQHRQVGRDFELVLIDATNPFGFNHVLPRGLLREPLGGLSRAAAFLITRGDQVAVTELMRIRSILARFNSCAPIFCANHTISGFRCGNDVYTVDSVRKNPLFVFCAIGNPTALRNQLEKLGVVIAGWRTFPDHYEYTNATMGSLLKDKTNSGASAIVTTEKDWVKIGRLNSAFTRHVFMCIQLSLTFWNDDEAKLLELVRLSIARPAR